ncbi:tetratricopeptide repeat protein [Kolteria novifilia]|uniref:tetratricopeptide repeat protein n=1 Tax=Kolteria novifilia TaxID=2527975 RepID=UPI003AF394B8
MDYRDEGNPMAEIAPKLQAALALHQRGDLDAAERSYRNILRDAPGHPDAQHLLGLVLHARGRTDEALTSIDQAIERHDNPTYWANRGAVCLETQRLDEAATAFEKVAQARPEDIANLERLAAVLIHQQRWNDAIPTARAIRDARPENPEAHVTLGNLLFMAQQPWEAETSFRAALKINPHHANAWYNLGNVLVKDGRVDEALDAFRQAATLQPGHAKANANTALMLLQRNAPHEALPFARRANEHASGDANNLFILANTLHRLEQAEEAIALFRQVLGQQPRHPGALQNLANLLRELGRFDGAETVYRELLSIDPDSAIGHWGLGETLERKGNLAEAESELRRAVELEPLDARFRAALTLALASTCDWRQRDEVDQVIADTRSTFLGGQPMVMTPSMASKLPFTGRDRLAIAQRFSRDLTASLPPNYRPLADERIRTSGPRRRIGYLSHDFRDHATSHLMGSVFGCHDKDHFEVFAYSMGPDDGSEFRRRIAEDGEHFVDVAALTPQAIAERIASDGIDILVDLMGYAANHRAGVLALRPAPVQVNYLGFPGSMGADFIDYLIADPIIAPSTRSEDYQESLVLLPHCYQPTDHRFALPEAPSRSTEGLPEKDFVYCCFNTGWKIEPDVFGCWMSILRQVPESVLWLLPKWEACEPHLRREAEAAGIDASRLVFAPVRSRYEHLARHRLADLFLDTFFCTAHTTANDAMLAGVPLLTLLGESFQERVAASVVTAAGLPELVVDDKETYVERAVVLATTERERLRELRSRLDTLRSSAPLFDTPQMVHYLEAAFRQMWSRFERGQAPAMMHVSDTAD